MTGLYLLHFDPPYKHARHYLGWSSDIRARVHEHVAGAGSPLVRAAVGAGCAVRLVRVWPHFTRNDEREAKRSHNVPRLCPTCHSHRKGNA